MRDKSHSGKMVLVKTWLKLPPTVQEHLIRLNKHFSRVKDRTAVFDKRTGILTVALPFTLLMLTTVVTGTQIIDKQFELRLLRRQSVSLREHQHEEQRKQYLQFLSQTESWDKLDNSVPVPRDSE